MLASSKTKEEAAFKAQLSHLCEGLSHLAGQNLQNELDKTMDTFERIALEDHAQLFESLQTTPLTYDQLPFYASFLYVLTKEAGFLTLMAQRLDQYRYNVPLFHNLVWQIKRLLFRDYLAFTPTLKQHIHDELMRPAYNKLLADLAPTVNAQLPAARKINPAIKKVALLTPQFLGLGHSPSRQCLAMAGSLNELGIEPHIINTNNLPFANPTQWVQSFVANRTEAFNGKQGITVDYMEYKQLPVWLYTPNQLHIGLTKIVEIITYLEDNEIDAVISCGDNLMIQDFIYQRIPSLYLTLGQGLPFSPHDYYWLWGGSTESQYAIALAQRLGLSEAIGFHKGIIVLHEAGDGISRSDLGLPEEAFIYAVVGNRLSYELDDVFLDVCQAILKEPNTFIVFIGETTLSLDKALGVTCERYKCLPYQRNLTDVLKVCDAFLNPFREGGATGGTIAADIGIPVLTMDDCHNGCLAGPEVAFKTLEAFREGVLRVCKDKAYTQHLQETTHAFVFDQTNTETMAQMIAKLQKIATQPIYTEERVLELRR